jgi:hypothetical protein
MMLETLSWIAAIIAVPVAVVGWFMSGTRKAIKSVASKGGTAISADMHVKEAGEGTLVAYLNEMRTRAAKFQAIMISMEALPPGDEKVRASAAAGEQRLWLIDQIDGLPKRFESVLRF